MDEYLKIRDSLKTGDIVLFSGKGEISDIIKWIQRSTWSHVGMIVKLPDWDMILLWESTSLSTPVDIIDKVPRKGVMTVALSDRLNMYDGDIAIRQLNQPITPQMEQELISFRKEVNGRPYEKQTIDLLKSTIDNSSWLGENTGDLSSIFCSELVAEAYQRLGLLSTDKPSDEYTPKDFSTQKNLVLNNMYSLGPEIQIKKGS